MPGGAQARAARSISVRSPFESSLSQNWQQSPRYLSCFNKQTYTTWKSRHQPHVYLRWRPNDRKRLLLPPPALPAAPIVPPRLATSTALRTGIRSRAFALPGGSATTEQPERLTACPKPTGSPPPGATRCLQEGRASSTGSPPERSPLVSSRHSRTPSTTKPPPQPRPPPAHQGPGHGVDQALVGGDGGHGRGRGALRLRGAAGGDGGAPRGRPRPRHGARLPRSPPPGRARPSRRLRACAAPQPGAEGL